MKDTKKRPYHAPVLTVHGDVKDITREAAAKNSDVPEGVPGTAYPVSGDNCTCV